MINSIDKLKLDLKKYLNQKVNYSYTNLKNNLELTSDDEFLMTICSLMNAEIDNFNFETPVYYNKYLFKCINYLNNEDTIILNKNKILKKLDDIKQLINKKLNNNKSNTNAAVASKAFLLSLNSEINYTISKLKYDETNRLENVSINEIYKILSELIFKVKNPVYIEEILNNYPNLITTKKDNRYLFEDVYDKYLNVLLNRNDEYELLYYNKLITIFIKGFKDNSEIKHIILNKVDKMLSSLDKKNISLEKQEKIKFYMQELIELCNNEKISLKQMEENLKLKYNLKRIKELDNFKIMKPSWKDYKQSSRYVLTFDDPHAKIFENALSLSPLSNGNYILSIYVSDIVDFLEENGELEKYILDNAMSIKGFPMVPSSLSKRLSLEEGKRKKAIAYLFEFDSKLNVVSFRVEKQIIKVKHNLKFSDVKKILDYPEDTRLKREVNNLYAFSKYITINKEDKKEYHIIKEISKKLLYDNDYTEKNMGAKMVSDYQIFLNSFIPKYCYERKLPYLYRNNEFNRSIELINEIKDRYKDNLNLQDILSFIYAVYEPSMYSTENKGHMGLNLEAYGEVSKPIRSSASIINQKLMNKYLIDGLVLNDDTRQRLTNELNKICNHLNEKRIMYDNYAYENKKLMKKCKK